LLLTIQVGELPSPLVQWAVGGQYFHPCILDGEAVKTNNTIMCSCAHHTIDNLWPLTAAGSTAHM